MLLQRVASFFIAVVANVVAIPFPNDIIGVPEVICEPNQIQVKVKTTAGNPSHMFVTNYLEDPTCVTRNTNKIVINHDACGLTRERTVNPPGVIFRVCVAIQLHPQFVTKVDRTFCAQCVYMEAVKDLDRTLAVSAQGTTEVPVTFEMPTCTYTIRRGTQAGEEIHYATVGETVFHVWSCPSETNGMLVQNCYVEDGQGNRILIVDQNGCGVDQYIMQTPIYGEKLSMAYQESHVFKFADKTITRFTCQIKLCVIAGGGCQGVTPPSRCPAGPLGAGGYEVAGAGAGSAAPASTPAAPGPGPAVPGPGPEVPGPGPEFPGPGPEAPGPGPELPLPGPDQPPPGLGQPPPGPELPPPGPEIPGAAPGSYAPGYAPPSRKVKKTKLRKTRSALQQLINESRLRLKRDIKLFSNSTIASEIEFSDDYQMDVSTGDIRILDTVEDVRYYDKMTRDSSNGQSTGAAEIFVTPDAVCIARLGFATMVVTIGLLCAIIVLSILGCLLRRKLRTFGMDQRDIREYYK
uniref:ZP domain-containing protein n=1 Tax=Plectus sambesii TaxID=2011161 RepID=A0A914X8Q7_9BILA